MRVGAGRLRPVSAAVTAGTRLLSSLPGKVPDQTPRLGLKSNRSLEVLKPVDPAGRNAAVSVQASTTGMDVSNQAEMTSAKEGMTTWDIRLLYDGDCPLCMREVAMLMSRDGQQGKIDFVDIASPSYNPAANQGITYEMAMERIHGVLPDGSVVTNIEVFRRCYEAVGLGWLYAVTKYYPFGAIANAAYELWAKNRLRATGRPDLADLLEERKSAEMGATCDEDSCEIPFRPRPKNN